MNNRTQNMLQLVAKHNDLIQNARYDLTVSQQRVILYCISKIKPQDATLKWIEIPILEFCDILEISPKNWYDNKRIDDILETLKQTAFTIEKKSDTQTIKKPFQWIYDYKRVKNAKKGNSIGIMLSEDLREYLLQLKSNYTSYELINIITLKKKYSIRLFELLKSYAGRDIPPTIEVDELKSLLSCDAYSFDNFNRRILQQSIAEINAKTFLSVSVDQIRQGRKVIALKFKIKDKPQGEINEILAKQHEKTNIELGQNPNQIWLVDALRNAQNGNPD